MATFTLSDLKKSVDSIYAPTIIENGGDSYKLVNLMQLPTEKREKATKIWDSYADDTASEEKDISSEDQMKIFKDLIIAVTEDDKGEELVELLGDNPGMVTELVAHWVEGSELGEV